MNGSRAFKAGIGIIIFSIVILIIIVVWGSYPIHAVRASPISPPGTKITSPPECAYLDDPQILGLMSGAYELALRIQCGRTSEVMLGKSAPFVPGELGSDVLVNDPSDEIGESATQNETSLARSETNGILCSVYNDSFFVPLAGFTGFSSSNDNGSTWVDHGDLQMGGDWAPMGDPSLIWRKSDGHFYLSTLMWQYLIGITGFQLWDLGTDCSTVNPLGFIHGSTGDDNEMMTVDNNPSSPYYGRIYVAWVDFNYNNGHIRTSHSDNTINWSPPLDASLKDNVQGAWPAVDPVNNDVYISWIHWDTYPNGPVDIDIIRSTNGGDTFGYVTNPVSNVVNPRDQTASADCGRPALNGDISYWPMSQIVVDHNSNLHVVYSYDPDGYNTGDVVNVYYRRSTDHGETWGPELKINDDATITDQFFPALAVSPSGTVGVFWYDRRYDSNNLEVDYFEATSTDNGLTFKQNERVSDVTSPIIFNPLLAPCYHGDYDTSTADDTRFYIQWADDRRGDSDVYMDTGFSTVELISGLQAVNDSPTYIGDTTNFSATVESGIGVSYTWAFGDDTFADGQFSSHAYASIGSYTATVTATNAISSATTSTYVSIVDVPITGLVASNDGPTGLGSTTTLSATVDAGTNVIYLWDFGDDTTGEGQVVTHVYSEAGSFIATVTATNTQGDAIAMTEVTVLSINKYVYLPLTIK